MIIIRTYFLILLPTVILSGSSSQNDEEFLPTVMVALFVRNKAHTLPYFFSLLHQLDYPKKRISIYLRSDHNEDASAEVVRAWLDEHQGEYHSVNVKLDEESSGVDVQALTWTKARFRRIMELKEAGLREARRIWADFVWFLDVDVLLTNNQTLRDLIALGHNGHTASAPMLKSLDAYANFWAGMNDKYYYKRTDEYFPILEKKQVGCFPVPMIHSCVLVNLKRTESKHLTFLPENIQNYDGPYDDIIVFALSAKLNNVPVYVCNSAEFGYLMLPLDEDQELKDDYKNLLNLNLQIIADVGPMPVEDALSKFLLPLPAKDSLGVDKVYMVNLKRRPDRKLKMDTCLDLLGVQYQLIDAVDGKTLDSSYMQEKGIRMLPRYSDRFHKRVLTYGEIGCFMSHYSIWSDMVENDYERVIVFEDDIRFEPFFREKTEALLEELKRLDIDWDLVYLGRKIMENANEPWVEGSNQLVHVDYAYWTLGYLLNRRGAKVLLEEKPLSKMVPVDEYLPIMYDRHPNATWKEYFGNRVLKAFSAAPRLLHPTHYTGEKGYISDTEATGTIASFEESHIKNDEL